MAKGGTASQRCTHRESGGTPNPKPAVNFQSNLLSVSLYLTKKEFENGRICGRNLCEIAHHVSGKSMELKSPTGRFSGEVISPQVKDTKGSPGNPPYLRHSNRGPVYS